MEMKPIIDHLVKETSLFEELVSILQKENEDLVCRDYKALYETVCQKEHILVRIQDMERVRIGLIEDAAARLGIPGQATLFNIIKKLDHAGKEELESRLSKILSIAESIKEINRVNSLIVEGCLDNVNKTLGFLGKFLNNNSYNTSGAFEGFAVKGTYLNEGV